MSVYTLPVLTFLADSAINTLLDFHSFLPGKQPLSINSSQGSPKPYISVFVCTSATNPRHLVELYSYWCNRPKKIFTHSSACNELCTNYMYIYTLNDLFILFEYQQDRLAWPSPCDVAAMVVGTEKDCINIYRKCIWLFKCAGYSRN